MSSCLSLSQFDSNQMVRQSSYNAEANEAHSDQSYHKKSNKLHVVVLLDSALLYTQAFVRNFSAIVLLAHTWHRSSVHHFRYYININAMIEQ